MGTQSVELMNFLNPELSKNRVSEGNKSGFKRPKQVARKCTVPARLPDESTQRLEETTDSESEKLGVVVHGGCLSDKIEHLPIKKRRFIFRSPSPPPQIDSSRLKVSEQFIDIHQASNQECSPNEKLCGEDLLSMDVLPAAARNNNMFDGIDLGHKDPENSEVGVLTRERIYSRISGSLSEGTVALLETSNLFPTDTAHKDNSEGSSSQGNTMAVSPKSPSDEGNKTVERFVGLRDDRSHWDLNITVDAWGKPFASMKSDSQTDAVANESEKSLALSKGHYEKEREVKDDKHDTANKVVFASVHGGIFVSSVLTDLLLESCELHREKSKLELCSNLDVNSDESVPPQTDAEQPFSSAVAGSEVSGQIVGSGDGERISGSDASVFEGLPVQIPPTKAQPDEASQAHAMAVDPLVNGKSEQLIQRFGQSTLQAEGELTDDETSRHGSATINCLDQVNVDSSNRNDFDGCQDAKATVGTENSLEFEDGYDSQIEDGELREINVPFWEENKGEYEEVEQMDYESECDEERLHYLKAANSKKEVHVTEGITLVAKDVIERIKHVTTGDVLRDSSESSKTISSEVIDGNSMNKDSAYCVDEPDGQNILSAKVGLSSFKKNSLSRIEGSFSSDASNRSRSNNLNKSRSQAEGVVSLEQFKEGARYAFHVQGRRGGSDNFVNSSAGNLHSKWHYSRTCRGPYGSDKSGSEHVKRRGYEAVSEDAGVAGTENRFQRQFFRTSSNGAYRPFIRRSPAEKDCAYGMHTGRIPVRDCSADRNRFRRHTQGFGRSVRAEQHWPIFDDSGYFNRPPHHTQGLGRSVREEQHRPIFDGSTRYFSCAPHHLPRRGRNVPSFSGGRPNYTTSYRKSEPRSRSRSPVSWLSPTEQNEGSRQHSRSPDFKSSARTERTMLFQKQYEADCEEGFLSLPRCHFSSQRKSRWFEGQNSGLDDFRGRKSPVRMMRQNERFDSVHPIRRLNEDDYFRSMMQRRRNPDMTPTGRTFKYESSDDEGQRNSFSTIHKASGYEKDDIALQFQYNASDSFVANDS